MCRVMAGREIGGVKVASMSFTALLDCDFLVWLREDAVGGEQMEVYRRSNNVNGDLRCLSEFISLLL